MIKIEGLAKSYGPNTIFNDFKLAVDQGEALGIVGESGRGKTTLLNIIGSLEAFDAGRVRVNKRNIGEISHKERLEFFRNEVSFLFQNYALMEKKTVYDNIIMGQKLNKRKEEMVKEALEDVNLSGFEDRIINTLSGGEQQRVALARIMVKPSKLILADEPTGNLDEGNSNMVWDSLLKLKARDKTILVVTHELEALDYFERVIYL